MAGVCLAGLVSRTLPDVWPTSAEFGASRLDYPLTYWNAEGMLAAASLVLLFHLCADTDEPVAVRVIAAGLVPPVAVALLLTFSRGALGVAVVGLVVYALARPPARPLHGAACGRPDIGGGAPRRLGRTAPGHEQRDQPGRDRARAITSRRC